VLALGRYRPVEHLNPDHDTTAFDCGSPEPTLWLQRHALNADRADTARVFVVTRADDMQVVGYYALATGGISQANVPPRIAQGTGRHPLPVMLLARLGVDLAERGRGLGKALVSDAIRRVVGTAEMVGVRALLIHAEDDTAPAFYLHLAAFEPSPTDPFHLLLLMKDAHRALGVMN
jgi:GNAT superfamily N-acetyltransferase